MGRVGATDWPKIIEELKANPGKAILIGHNIPSSRATYVKRRYGVEAWLENQSFTTQKGSLYVRWPYVD